MTKKSIFYKKVQIIFLRKFPHFFLPQKFFWQYWFCSNSTFSIIFVAWGNRFPESWKNISNFTSWMMDDINFYAFLLNWFQKRYFTTTIATSKCCSVSAKSLNFRERINIFFPIILLILIVLPSEVGFYCIFFVITNSN